jgi:preprotein translocase subunit SecD
MLNLPRWKLFTVIAALILGLMFSLPNVLPQSARDGLPGFMPKQGLNLGLDLQGGSYLLLEVDTQALKRERLTDLMEDIRNILRQEKIAFSGLGEQGGVITVRVTDPAQLDDAFQRLQSIGGMLKSGGREFLSTRGDDQTVKIQFANNALTEISSNAVDQSIEIIRKRIDSLGTKEPIIVRQGATRIVVQAPGESDPERLKAVIGKTAKLTFQMVNETVPLADAVNGAVPPDSVLLPSDDAYAPAYLLKKRVVVSGENLTDASQAYDQQSGRAVVSFRFNGVGATRFADTTANNIGKRFAIVLDGRVISAPTIQSAITGGSGQITGNFTVESARDLSNLLKSGALPAPLTVQEQRTVGAELGADAVEAGKLSTAVGFISILVFMLLSYGLLFGGISVIALIFNGLLIIAAMSATQATLTLPGIAGLILTLAVAVDANVLIYERMRDEFRSGRALLASMEAGFSRAMETIIDANITTLLAAMIMFKFGQGPVRGFAWTLSIGVITSVFTAVVITQVLLGLWYRAARPKTLPIA